MIEITKWIDLSSWINGETGGYLRVCTEGRNWFETFIPVESGDLQTAFAALLDCSPDTVCRHEGGRRGHNRDPHVQVAGEKGGKPKDAYDV